MRWTHNRAEREARHTQIFDGKGEWLKDVLALKARRKEEVHSLAETLGVDEARTTHAAGY